MSVVRTALWLPWLTTFLLLLYLRGYLLTKTEIQLHSTCHDYAHGACWSTPRYKRAVLVLVDALRHDFTTYNSSEKHPQPWQNKMPIFSELQGKFPNRTRHIEFIADPPSATFLRLKGLTTGGLPTFVDLGSNFGANEILEDSWVRQLAANNKKLVFIGDDTWMGIYQKHFHRAFPFPSFDVWDLHTVDEGVREHLLPQMKTPDWDVIVAHFLGVDHAGHRYHVNHPALADKLAQINSWIGEIVGALEQDTVLFLFGDHGMTSSGDHGGETHDEITSSLFIYSPSGLGDVQKEEERAIFDPVRVYQTDIVPTLTMLLGVPIPYSSLGSLIPLLFLDGGRVNLQRSLNTNMNQVARYIEAYSLVSSEFSADSIADIKRSVEEINERFARAPDLYSVELVAEMQRVIGQIRELCSRHWAEFNLPLMTLGIFLMLILSACLLVMPHVISPPWWNLIPAVFICIVALDRMSLWSGATHPLSVFLTIVSTAFTLAKPIKTQLGAIKSVAEWVFEKTEFCDATATIIILMMSVGFTTNSYILVEDYVTVFFFGTLILVNWLQEYQVHGFKMVNTSWTLVVLISSRASAIFFGCREEQFWCSKTWWLGEVAEDLKSSIYTLSVAVFTATMYGMYWYQKHQGSLVRLGLLSVHVVLGPIQVILVGVFWALTSSTSDVISETQLCWLPRIVYLLSLVAVCIVVWNPLTAYLQSSSSKPLLFGCVSCYSAPTLTLYAALLPSFVLLLRQPLSLTLSLLTLQLIGISRLLSSRSTFFKLAVCHVVMLQYFYATDHQAAVQQFDWNAAFVGFTTHPTHIIPVFMIVLRTLMCGILVTLFAPTILLASRRTPGSQQEVDITASPDNAAQLAYFIRPAVLRARLYDALRITCSLTLFKCAWACLACSLHRRHLMIWNIFTPRMIIEMCFTVCTGATLVCVVFMLHRTDVILHRYLDRLYKKT